MKTIDQLGEIQNLILKYKQDLDKLNQSLHISSFYAYYYGYNAKYVEADIIDKLRECVVEYYKTACSISLQELENLDIDIRKERESLRRICYVPKKVSI